LHRASKKLDGSALLVIFGSCAWRRAKDRTAAPLLLEVVVRTDASKSGSETRVKTLTFGVRCTREEKALLQSRADAFGISMGELCRETIFGSRPKSKTDQAAITELAAMRADLGRLGGLLKGWLSGAFPAAPLPQHDQVRALLHDIEAAQKKVLAAVTTLVGTA
jgi:hypothetical protein